MALSFESLAKHRSAILRRVTSILIVAVAVLLDRLTKAWAVAHLKSGDDVEVIDWLFRLTYVENKGAAWGMLADQRWIFMSISTLTIVILSYMIFSGTCRTRIMEFSVAAILAGGLGNMIDRTSMGYVVDMIEFTFMDFPVFNIADCFVVVGTAILLVTMIYEIVREERIARRDAEYDQLLAELEARGDFDEEENEAFFDNLALDGVEREVIESARREFSEDELEELRTEDGLERGYHARAVNRETVRRNLTDSLLPTDEEPSEDGESSKEVEREAAKLSSEALGEEEIYESILPPDDDDGSAYL